MFAMKFLSQTRVWFSFTPHVHEPVLGVWLAPACACATSSTPLNARAVQAKRSGVQEAPKPQMIRDLSRPVTGIMEISNYNTPEKTNMDTHVRPYLKPEPRFSKPFFWGSMLVFGGVPKTNSEF